MDNGEKPQLLLNGLELLHFIALLKDQYSTWCANNKTKRLDSKRNAANVYDTITIFPTNSEKDSAILQF